MSANYSVTHFEAATAIESAGPNQMNSLSMDANGTSPAAAASDATMAPPQTPGQPAIVPAAQRGSVDELSDPGQTPQTGDKRKRVKASRACDECRRKKVCDNVRNNHRGIQRLLTLLRFDATLPLSLVVSQRRALTARKLASSANMNENL